MDTAGPTDEPIAPRARIRLEALGPAHAEEMFPVLADPLI